MGGMVKDTMTEPMNEMKNQLADQMKQSFAGISKGFCMFGKKSNFLKIEEFYYGKYQCENSYYGLYI